MQHQLCCVHVISTSWRTWKMTNWHRNTLCQWACRHHSITRSSIVSYKGRFTRGPKSQVLVMLASPNMEAKYQLVSLKKIWLIIIKVIFWLFYAKIFTGFGLRVGSSFLLDLTHNASPKLHLQKVLPCRHPCHSWDLGLGIPCEVISPNFHALNGWDCIDRPHVTGDLGLMWNNPKLARPNSCWVG